MAAGSLKAGGVGAPSQTLHEVVALLGWHPQRWDLHCLVESRLVKEGCWCFWFYTRLRGCHHVAIQPPGCSDVVPEMESVRAASASSKHQRSQRRDADILPYMQPLLDDVCAQR
jgi:hypothetical protein